MSLENHQNSEWPAEGLEYLGCCPVCGSRNRVMQYANLRDRLFAAPGIWTMYQCENCDVRYLDPRPDTSSIGMAYAAYYTHQEIRENTGDTLRGWFKLGLKNGYLNNTWHSALSPAFPRIARILSRIVPSWTNTFDHVVLRDLPKVKSGHLLDIGCGNGAYIKRIKALGWTVRGIDLDRQAIEYAKAQHLDVMEGDLSVFDGEQELFDVVTANHVVEHVHDPVAFLQSCWRLLKPGGMLRIESPNFNSTGSMEFGESWRGLEPPRHLVLFTHDNMKNCLHKVGFREISHSGWMPQYGPMFQLSKNLKNRISQEAVNLTILEKWKIRFQDAYLRKCESRREFFTFNCVK